MYLEMVVQTQLSWICITHLAEILIDKIIFHVRLVR